MTRPSFFQTMVSFITLAYVCICTALVVSFSWSLVEHATSLTRTWGWSFIPHYKSIFLALLSSAVAIIGNYQIERRQLGGVLLLLLCWSGSILLMCAAIANAIATRIW